MAKINIVTGNNSFSVNGVQRGKSRIVVNIGENSISIGGYHASLEEVEIDGETFADMESLRAALDAKVFKSGGGDGDGVTQAELDARVPVLALNNFLVGGADGNEGRTIQAPDLGYTTGGGLRIVSILNGALTTPFPASSSILNSSAVVRTSTGQGKFSPSSAADEAVVQSQFEGAVNDTLTASETSATLNASYPNVVIGFTVITETGLSEYRKISATDWVKKTIESI